MSRKACYIFSSSPSQGATNIQYDGSRFSVFMNYPLHIPNGAKDATLEVIQACSKYMENVAKHLSILRQ